ncbi:GNAT family N-acetyltransferase [Microbacterium sp. RD1]|uniref:GNAT family N-acetyltransferase n=1 Tax=Microbacterium sp. RD1 TaxID=3457313 RepID=UPI003FA57D2C
MRMRPYRPGDERALAEVCLRTADAGGDATGVLDDDGLWAEIFVLPYVARHPEFAFVVADDDDRVVGYLVATPDTRAFERWFREEWWPRFAARWPEPTGDRTRQDGILRYAYARGPGAEPYGDEFPAHLHIDLLPEAQGRGWGRRLIDALIEALREAGVSGLHLVATADNTGALAFYRRLGFAALPSPAGVQAFGRAV